MSLWSKLRAMPRWLFGLAGSTIETVSPRDLAVMRMGVTELRIKSYWNAHGKLPAALSDLPPLPKRDNAVTDGLGKPFGYRVTGPKTAVISAAGEERVVVVD